MSRRKYGGHGGFVDQPGYNPWEPPYSHPDQQRPTPDYAAWLHVHEQHTGDFASCEQAFCRAARKGKP